MKSAIAIAADLDLNLLRVLVALAHAENVSRAAEMLGMSQSGFSTALARLRLQFADEMFIRVAGRMRPTARAQAMIGPATAVLSQVSQHILSPPVFDAATSATRFSVAMADIAELVYLPTLLQHFAQVAPGVSLVTQLPPGEALREAMAASEIDLAVGYFPDLGTQQFFKQRLYVHTYACIARAGHPLAKRMDLAAYCNCGHAVPARPTRSMALVDQFLQRKGIQRRVVLQTPHHLVLGAVVAETDLIATVPVALAAHLADSAGVQVLALPFVPPTFVVQQHWHRGVHKDLRNQWLRHQVQELFARRSQRWSAYEGTLYGAPAPLTRTKRRPVSG